MTTIIRVYKKNDGPSQKVAKILDQVDTMFMREDYDIEDVNQTLKKKAISIISNYSTTNVPFLLFRRKDGTEYAAHYQEEGIPTVEIIEQKLQNGI